MAIISAPFTLGQGRVVTLQVKENCARMEGNQADLRDLKMSCDLRRCSGSGVR